jgi:hypothetical protein
MFGTHYSLVTHYITAEHMCEAGIGERVRFFFAPSADGGYGRGKPWSLDKSGTYYYIQPEAVPAS